MRPFLFLILPFAADACSMGHFSATSSYVFCVPTYNRTRALNGSSQTTTVASTQGFISMISGPTESFACQVLLAPNASLGVSRAFSFQFFYNNLDSPVNFYACTATDCNNLYKSVADSSSFVIPTDASSVLVSFSLGAPFTKANTFLLSWNSGINAASCPSCTDLLPVPSGANWAYNSVEGCAWQCNPGFSIPTAAIPLSADCHYVVTGPVDCTVACNSCPAGQYADCYGIATSNQGTYGAVINAASSPCRQCTVCPSGYWSACSQYKDAVCKW